MIPKFRGYIKSIEKIVDVTEIDLKNKMVTLDIVTNEVMPEWSFLWKETVLSFESVELMQSTGLKDKNGVEIFEGDIIKPLGFASWIGVVKYCDKVGAFILDDHNNEFIRSDNVYLSQFTDSFEILGNIYENSELLED